MSNAASTPGQPLGVAVVGCGGIAQAQHLPNIAASPRLNLIACCDTSDAALEQCREPFRPRRTSHDFNEVVRDPDVHLVLLATTERLRLPVIRAAAEAGKAIYIEKPLARSLDECEEIRRIVHAHAVPFCIGHNRRSSPAMLEAHAIARRHMQDPRSLGWRWDREQHRDNLPQDGAPGFAVRINDDWHSWKSWVFDLEQSPHGPMVFEMTHFTDLCNWFIDDVPESVTALDSGYLFSGVAIRYRGGGMATICMYANGTFAYPKELYEFFGKGAAVVIDHMLEVRTAGIPGVPARTTYNMLRDRHPNVGPEAGFTGWLAKRRAGIEEARAAGDAMLQFTAEPDKGHARHLERFIDQIQGIGDEVCGVDAALLATRVAFAAVQSAKEGRVIHLT